MPAERDQPIVIPPIRRPHRAKTRPSIYGPTDAPAEAFEWALDRLHAGGSLHVKRSGLVSGYEAFRNGLLRASQEKGMRIKFTTLNRRVTIENVDFKGVDRQAIRVAASLSQELTRSPARVNLPS